jgi:hypothetical protein
MKILWNDFEILRLLDSCEMGERGGIYSGVAPLAQTLAADRRGTASPSVLRRLPHASEVSDRSRTPMRYDASSAGAPIGSGFAQRTVSL